MFECCGIELEIGHKTKPLNQKGILLTIYLSNCLHIIILPNANACRAAVFWWPMCVCVVWKVSLVPSDRILIIIMALCITHSTVPFAMAETISLSAIRFELCDVPANVSSYKRISYILEMGSRFTALRHRINAYVLL